MDEIQAALLGAVERLNDAVRGYAGPAREAAKAAIQRRDTAEMLVRVTEEETAKAHEMGLTGSNETARLANLRHRLNHTEVVKVYRDRAADAAAQAETAEAEARIWDVRQKAARAEVAALTALAIGGDRG